MAASNEEPVSWELAARVAAQALRRAPQFNEEDARRAERDFERVTERAAVLVEQATGLVPVAEPVRAVVVDRLGWVEKNIDSFRRLLSPLMSQLSDRPGRKVVPQSAIGAAAAGAEVGLLLAWISSRVLGQYDLFPSEEEDEDAIYYVGPNIAGLERRHGFAPDEFRLWIAIHEMTHRVQFRGVPWMREYFLSLLERGAAIAPPDARSVLAAMQRALGEVREGRNPIGEGGIVSLLATAEQLSTLHEAQALMSLLEGHADVIMQTAGEGEVPGAARFARVLSERRSSARGAAKVIQQALGIDAKLRQYADGERFVEEVRGAGGDELFARVWSGPELLPTMEEIRSPSRWIERSGITVDSSL